MARPRKKLAKKKTAKKKSAKKKTAKKAGHRGVLVPTLDDVVVVTPSPEPDPALRLTAEILDLDRTGKRSNVHRIRAIGQRLLALQQHLGFGSWLRWLSDRLPYAPRTAQAYIALAAWAEQFPDDFAAFAHLGVAKLQLLAALTPARRRRFRQQQTFTIPGAPQRKALDVMTVVELRTVISGIGGLQALPPTQPATQILQRFAHRTAALDALADQLRARADELDVDDVRGVYDRLQAVVDELEQAFFSG